MWMLPARVQAFPPAASRVESRTFIASHPRRVYELKLKRAAIPQVIGNFRTRGHF